MRRAGLFLLLLAGALSTGLPARGQFYDLDGAYRCLMAADADCAKDLADRPTAKPSKAAATPAAASFADIVKRVRDKTATAGDIAFLTGRAEADDPRAVEVLAWCRLNGIGAPRDPVAAYWLYRKGAALGVPHARENQIAIYERQLSSAERQQVLAGENRP